jgi:anti-sigma factor RsiW
MSDPRPDFSSELTAYIDGELAPEQARAVEAALERDPALRALEQRLRRTIAAVEALPQPEPDTQALRRKVLAAVEAPSWRERLSSWFTVGRLAPAGVAVAGAAAAVVVLAGRSDHQEDVDVLLAANLDDVEDLDLVGAESPDDLDVIGSLHELEVER